MARTTLLILALASAWGAVARGAPPSASLPQAAPLSEADVDLLEIADPEKRLSAIAEFGSLRLYHGGGSTTLIIGDEKADALYKRAATLARRHRDPETVSRALDTEDARLQMWGLWFWRGGMFAALEAADRVPRTLPSEGRTPAEIAWHALTPKLRRLARESPRRGLAIDALTMSREENQDFLHSLIPDETSAGVILQLLNATITQTNDEARSGRYEARDHRFNEELQRLLTSADAKVRHEALEHTGMTWNSAEMWQTHFSSPVIALVAKLRKANDAEDRRLANFAAEGLEKLAHQRREKRREQRGLR